MWRARLQNQNSIATSYIVVFLALLMLALSLRSFQPHRFSFWNFGDAQTMMAASAYRDEGFLKTSFLWIPQWSSPISRFLDDPELRQHAHGSSGDAWFSGLGPKRRYTHWPSWYSVPYGVLAKLGLFDKSIFQLWASLLSILSLWFLYLFVRRIADPLMGLVAVTIYALSPAFLVYADSLATMPYDDFFRFAFLAVWVKRALGEKSSLLVPALLYLGSLLTSLDSFLFIPLVAVGSELTFTKKIPGKTILVLAGIGFLAIAVQGLQNISYLGPFGAWQDWKGYFFAYGSTPLSTRFGNSFALIIGLLGVPGVWCLFALLCGFVSAAGIHRRLAYWLGWLLLGGLAFPFVIPLKATMRYEVRQLMPFVVLAMSCFVVGLSRVVEIAVGESRLLKRVSAYAATLVLSTIAVFSLHGFSPHVISRSIDYPSEPHIHPQKIEFLRAITQNRTGKEVYFHFGDVFETKEYWKPGYGQVSPLEEFYLQGPILTVPDFEALQQDLEHLWSKAPGEFLPVVFLREDQLEARALNAYLKKIKFGWVPEKISSNGQWMVYRLQRG